MELRGSTNPGAFAIDPKSLESLNITEFIDMISIRIDGIPAAKQDFTIMLNITDLGDKGTGYLLTMSNGALTHREAKFEANSKDSTSTATLTIWPSHSLLVQMVVDRNPDLHGQGVECKGDESVWGKLMGLITPFDPGFAIVTP